MPRGASPKREREYRELVGEFGKEGRYKGREEEVAARIVNKQRREKGETKAQRGQGGGSSKSKSGGGGGGGGSTGGGRGGSSSRRGGGSSSGRGSGSAVVTTDHDHIREWAESRGAKPACVRGTGGRGDTGMLRLDFPGYSGAQSLQHIGW